jgi:tetratricopeptide (TPR) repeat protein
MIDSALDVAASSSKAHTLRGHILRRRGKKREAEAALDNALENDPLDTWSVTERCFLDGKGSKALAAAGKNRGDKLQGLLEAVTDYGNVGAFDEALALLAQAEAAGGPYTSPLAKYYAGYYTLLQGKADAAETFFAQAAQMPVDLCFPFRHEELRMLEAAAAARPDDANTWYHLGNLCYYLEQRERSIAAWERAAALAPSHGLALRNLGFAYARVPEKRGLAAARYEAAVRAEPGYVTPVVELDRLYEKTGRAASDRLAFLESRMETVQTSDPAMLRLAYLYNETGQFGKALAILTTRRFHVWEGAEALRQPFVDACLLRGLARLKAGEAAAALEDFRLADTYPENLQAGRPGDAGQSPKIHFYTAQAYRALGRQEQAEAELRKALEGRVADGEMNYYRLLACRGLGDAASAAEQRKRLASAIGEFEKPAAVYAYAKFGGENTPAERVTHRTAAGNYLKGLAALADGDAAAAAHFAAALKERPAMIWAKAFFENRVN